MATKHIVCLAKSWRPYGLCIAGKTIEGGRIGQWVRPVDRRNKDAVQTDDITFSDGSQLKLLDIVQLKLLDHVPDGHQTENWTFDKNQKLRHVGEFARSRLGITNDHVSDLWPNGSRSSVGLNNRVESEDVVPISDSLRLIRVEALTLNVYDHENRDEKRVTGTFDYGGVKYTMQIKDVECEQWAEGQESGDYDLGIRYLTISLAGEFHGHCYKLIAGIM